MRQYCRERKPVHKKSGGGDRRLGNELLLTMSRRCLIKLQLEYLRGSLLLSACFRFHSGYFCPQPTGRGAHQFVTAAEVWKLAAFLQK